MKTKCDLSLKFNIIDYIHNKYNIQYNLDNINCIIFLIDSFIVLTDDNNTYKIKYEINFD